MELTTAPNESERIGACEAGPVEPLPMIVWLRGDEPWCGDFTLEAEDVMQRLSIKRSRLTQISGRELRVGRIRRGRYVSPVYRSIDVDEYLEWTRATATHLKASSVLQEAVAQLEDSSERLADRVAHATHAVSDSLHQVVSAASSKIIVSIQDDLLELRRTIAVASTQQTHSQESFARQLQLIRQSMSQQAATVEALSSTIAMLAQDLCETASLVRVMRQDTHDQLSQLQNDHSKTMDALFAAISPPPVTTSLSYAQLRRLSREKPRVLRSWGCGTGQGGQIFYSAAQPRDHKKSLGQALESTTARQKGAKRRPSRLKF